jgi:hypothetical protein
MRDLIVPFAVVGEFALIGLVIWIFARRQEQSARIRAELQLKLLERFTSVRELEEFLQTEAGRRLLPAASGRGLARVALTAQIGVAICVLAVGIITAAAFLGVKGMFAAGLMVMTAGLGLLAAAFLGHRLVRAWGLGGAEAGALPHQRTS